MATRRPDGHHIIAAGEVGAFSVCPLSWKLKWIDQETGSEAPSAIVGQKLHQDWSFLFDESLFLGRWIRYLAVLLTTSVVIFLLVHPSSTPLGGIFFLSVQSHGLQLMVLTAITFLVIRAFSKAARKRHRDTGFLVAEVAVAMEGSALLPAREYISEKQGLAGKPDAVIKEGEDILPVERKPLATKLRDRYVAQLLVYMRLVEEFEGRRPPHGYLLLGPECRRVTVQNSESKQRWVGGLLAQMRGVLDGAEAKPAPHRAKCAKCNVRDRCTARADAQPSS